MKKIFIDGSAGTTGLRIAERLESRKDIELIKLTEENRKDTAARKRALNEADIAFLCLPDAAAIAMGSCKEIWLEQTRTLPFSGIFSMPSTVHL